MTKTITQMTMTKMMSGTTNPNYDTFIEEVNSWLERGKNSFEGALSLTDSKVTLNPREFPPLFYLKENVQRILHLLEVYKNADTFDKLLTVFINIYVKDYDTIMEYSLPGGFYTIEEAYTLAQNLRNGSRESYFEYSIGAFMSTIPYLAVDKRVGYYSLIKAIKPITGYSGRHIELANMLYLMPECKVSMRLSPNRKEQLFKVYDVYGRLEHRSELTTYISNIDFRWWSYQNRRVYPPVIGDYKKLTMKKEDFIIPERIKNENINLLYDKTYR